LVRDARREAAGGGTEAFSVLTVRAEWMRFFCVEPEVAGGLGAETRIDAQVHPRVVGRLHYQFDGWLGDAVLESFPCFICTAALCSALKRAGVSGVEFAEVLVTVSDQFKELHPATTLPQFVWMRVTGMAGKDDAGTAPDGCLVVSAHALEILKAAGIEHALVSDFSARAGN
jgi:hypothetical protein